MDRYDSEPIRDVSADLDTLAASWQFATQEWRENLEEPCDEAVIWQIYPNGPSIGGLLLHMASCTRYWLQSVIDGVPQPDDDPAWAYDQTVDQYVPHWPAPPAQPISWYFEILDQLQAESMARILAHPDPLSEYRRNHNVVTYRWIVARVLAHESYTGGQAVLVHEAWKVLHGSGAER